MKTSPGLRVLDKILTTVIFNWFIFDFVTHFFFLLPIVYADLFDIHELNMIA